MKHQYVGMCLVLPSLFGCANVEPCSSVEEGDTVELSIVGEAAEYIDFDPLPSCGGFDEPPKKALLKMSGNVEHGICVVAGCPTDFPSPSELLFGGVVPGAGNQYVCERMGRKINVDGCEAKRDVVIRSSGADDFFSPSSTVVLIRRIAYAQGTELQCPDSMTIFPEDTLLPSEDTDGKMVYTCSDAWTVRLKKK